ncbi:MAG: hypothetical protein ACC612_11080 [Methanomethylovorans sp.]|uniref:hypothetical protein n=1 Tax=Methanomethylovorans sp. TaxID=2758717 RepID=UPI003530580F
MKKIGLYLFVVVSILVSGCISLSVDSKVNSKGELLKYNMVIDTNSYVYNLLDSNSYKESGNSLRDDITSRGLRYNEAWDGDNVKITINGSSSDTVKIEKVDGYLVYQDNITSLSPSYQMEDGFFGLSDAVDSAVTVHYYLEMPNDIIDSNANAVSGNKAEWHMLKASQMREVYAKCETPLLPGIRTFGTLCVLFLSFFILRKE